MGEEGRCASRGEMGESESVSPREVLFKVGGGGGETLGGGDRWVFMQSFMDDVDGRDEVDAPLVDDVLEGALGALGDEH